MNRDEMIRELVKLEPVFIKAGDVAAEQQKTIGSYNKFNTGQADFDIITKADLEVQETILQAMAQTSLRECHLLAEEDTPSTKLFSSKGNHFLTIDPIDGTSLYAKGKKYWSVIISLHDDKEIFYSFDYFPAAKWAHKIVGKKYEQIGEKPKIIKSELSKVISQTYGTTEGIDRKIYDEVTKQGYEFRKRKDLTDEAGSTALFLAGQVAGYFNPKILVYDCLVALHYAQATGCKIYSNGLDLGRILKDDIGMVYHPGYYIAVKY